MVKKWAYKALRHPEIVTELEQSLGIDSVLATLLVQRGIYDFDAAKNFFRPSLDNLYSPFLMKDMDEAVSRIDRAILTGERILVYGDYDVDGTTAVALVYSFFKKIYSNIGYYIPDRYVEGYGVSYKSIDYAYENGYSLVIALDCGIKAEDKVNYAKEKGIDFIICDHHLPGNTIPKAVAVLDPKRADCDYPYTELSGCGLGFKLAQGYCIKKGIPQEEAYEYLDLVAVSIASDIVPVIDENRVLSYFGLAKLNSNPSKGLRCIIRMAGIEKQQITIDDIVFRIGPRINAAGRMDSGMSAVDLLIAQSDTVANEVGSLVNSCNNDRKLVDRTITHEALRMIAANPQLQNRKTTVLFNPTWHKGVVGIVASRLIETYFRPTVILTESNGKATGSARSVPGFDLYQAIEGCSDLLENFGGHMYAAGLTLKTEDVPLFQARFEEVVSRTISPDMLIPQIDIDARIDFASISDKFLRILNQFQPFGPGNMAPVFSTYNVFDNGEGRLVGSEKEHIKLTLVQEGCPKAFQAIAFNLGEHYKPIHSGSPINVCYSITENVFRDNKTVQLRVRDIHYPDDEADDPLETETQAPKGEVNG